MTDTDKTELIEDRIKTVFGNLGEIKFDLKGRPGITLDELSSCMYHVVHDMLGRVEVLLSSGATLRKVIEGEDETVADVIITQAVDDGVNAVLREPSTYSDDMRTECGQVVRDILAKRKVRVGLIFWTSMQAHPSRGLLTAEGAGQALASA